MVLLLIQKWLSYPALVEFVYQTVRQVDFVLVLPRLAAENTIKIRMTFLVH